MIKLKHYQNLNIRKFQNKNNKEVMDGLIISHQPKNY
jgi:hypothetical protein